MPIKLGMRNAAQHSVAHLLLPLQFGPGAHELELHSIKLARNLFLSRQRQLQQLPPGHCVRNSSMMARPETVVQQATRCVSEGALYATGARRPGETDTKA
jgi:hypothetical protein